MKINGRLLGIRQNKSDDGQKIYNEIDVYDADAKRLISVNIEPEMVEPCKALQEKVVIASCRFWAPAYGQKGQVRFNAFNVVAAA